ncbi:tRNA pseudouridine(38-40) synthase TruA [Desulforegula conservatrix]|uniref:tRNA pseudouridine(38-40) synthase TruA n=1 Tax=Desulforegula conservatrix TaxID=153026 RepID=UPI000417BAC3|nr:tRNA pseudouridine(38-40) synthase TruA [Desulforegula conservatrix]
MEKTFKLTIQYDGTDYHGWQRQPGLATIQGELEKLLSMITRQQVIIEGSGRTDSGVHALGQVASFSVDTGLCAGDFFRALNGLLPGDICITECKEVANGFHARFDAVGKTYRYCILNRILRDPFKRKYIWQFQKRLDLEAMKEAAEYFVGEYDFKSFENAGSPRLHTVRHISSAVFKKADGGMIHFEVTANGFLQNMVRNIVGTLVDVGMSRTRPKEIKDIIAAKDRTKAGPTAPPLGLFLLEVYYPDQFM